MATLPGWQIHIPGHPDEVEVMLRRALAYDDRAYIRLSDDANALPHPVRPFRSFVVRSGSTDAPTIVAVGPMLDRVIAATTGLDVTLIYAATVRPFDHRTVMSAVRAPEIVMIEPYLEGTSAAEIAVALEHIPHRLLSIGVPRAEPRRYGSRHDHDAANGLDAPGIRARILRFLETTVAA